MKSHKTAFILVLTLLFVGVVYLLVEHSGVLRMSSGERVVEIAKTNTKLPSSEVTTSQSDCFFRTVDETRYATIDADACTWGIDRFELVGQLDEVLFLNYRPREKGGPGDLYVYDQTQQHLTGVTSLAYKAEFFDLSDLFILYLIGDEEDRIVGSRSENSNQVIIYTFSGLEYTRKVLDQLALGETFCTSGRPSMGCYSDITSTNRTGYTDPSPVVFFAEVYDQLTGELLRTNEYSFDPRVIN